MGGGLNYKLFDLYYDKYDRWYEKNRFVFLSELEAIKKALSHRNKMSLEIGVGTGRFAQELGVEVGLDPSLNMLKIAKDRGIKCVRGVGEDMPFKSFVFESVIIIFTLCFVEDPLKVLTEANRVLKSRGEIVIGFIDKESFLGKLYRIKKSSFYKEAKFFSVEEVKSLLTNAGFRDFRYWQTIFGSPEGMEFVETPKEGFGEGGVVIIKAQKV